MHIMAYRTGSLAKILERSFTKGPITRVLARSMSTSPSYEHVKVETPSSYVYHVSLNRPNKRNALNKQLWREIGECFDWLGNEKDCRVVILSGNGKTFCSGIDFGELMELGSSVQDESDPARKYRLLTHFIKFYQDWFSNIEKCPKPVIAAIQGGCIGGAVDLITATDIRLCTKDAIFCVKEVDMGIAADVGTLQRLPRILGNQSLVRELAFTARNMDSSEALRSGLVSQVLPDYDSLITAARQLAETIASKSPVAVQGTKVNLLYSRDHSVQDGLDFNRFWSGIMLQSEDVMKAAMSQITKDSEKPNFSKL